MYEDWRLYAFLSAGFAALTTILGKIGVSNVASDLATFIRTLVILFIAIVFVTVKREWLPPGEIAGRTYLFLALSGATTGLSWLAYYKALQLAPASKVAPVDKLSVVLVVIFAAIFLGEALSVKTVLGTLLIGFGVILLAL